MLVNSKPFSSNQSISLLTKRKTRPIEFYCFRSAHCRQSTSNGSASSDQKPLCCCCCSAQVANITQHDSRCIRESSANTLNWNSPMHTRAHARVCACCSLIFRSIKHRQIKPYELCVETCKGYSHTYTHKKTHLAHVDEQNNHSVEWQCSTHCCTCRCVRAATMKTTDMQCNNSPHVFSYVDGRPRRINCVVSGVCSKNVIVRSTKNHYVYGKLY